MNKRTYTLLYLFAALFVAACSDVAFDDESQQLVPMTIDAEAEATRTTLSEGAVQWTDGDEAAVYDFRTSKHRFVGQMTDGAMHFTGQVTAKSEPFAAIYPYDLAGETASSAAALSATLPAEQYAVADGFPAGLNISVAKGKRNIDGSPSSITFYNACQLLRFSVPAYAADKVRSITFTAPTAVAGRLTIDYSGTSPQVGIASSESKTITVLPPSGTTAFPAGTFYLLTAPVQLSGFSMTMQTADSKTYRLASSTTFGGQAGHVYSLGSIDLVNTPVISAEHVYADGLLQGTKVSLTGAPIEGYAWSATVKNSSGTVLRTLSGTGDLSSPETDASWPYLPKGNYTVEYTYTTSNGRDVTKTMSISLPAPSLTLSVDCYTAHTKYEQREIAAANLCNRLTVYNPSAKLNVANTLLENRNYTRTYSRTFNGKTDNETATTNSPQWSNYTSVPVSGSLYTFSVTANFAGTTATASKQVRITGLPYSINFTSHSEWSTDEGKITWSSNSVRFGREANLWQVEAGISTTSSVNIPAGTGFCADYSLTIQTATVGTTFKITAGDQTLLSITESGKVGDVAGTNHTYSNKTTPTVRDNSKTITKVTCHNSYGLSLTYAELYGLTLKYAE